MSKNPSLESYGPKTKAYILLVRTAVESMGVQNVLDKGVNASNLGRSIVQPFLRICGTKDAASFSVNDWKETEWVIDHKATLREFVCSMGVFEVDSDNIIVGYIPRKSAKKSESKPVSGIGMDQIRDKEARKTAKRGAGREGEVRRQKRTSDYDDDDYDDDEPGYEKSENWMDSYSVASSEDFGGTKAKLRGMRTAFRENAELPANQRILDGRSTYSRADDEESRYQDRESCSELVSGMERMGVSSAEKMSEVAIAVPDMMTFVRYPNEMKELANYSHVSVRIPNIVVETLESIKRGENKQNAYLASQSLEMIYSAISAPIGQRNFSIQLPTEISPIRPDTTLNVRDTTQEPILQCVMYYKRIYEGRNHVFLISDDSSLCGAAQENDINDVSFSQFLNLARK